MAYKGMNRQLQSAFMVLLLVVLAFTLTVDQSVVAQQSSPHFASGIKIGEVTDDSAIVWVRTTKIETPGFDRLKIFTSGLQLSDKDDLSMPVDVVPGQRANVRIRWWPVNNKTAVQSSDWVLLDQSTDFTHQFQLAQLNPGTRYGIGLEAKNDRTQSADATARIGKTEGTFATAPPASKSAPVKFIVSTCQAIRSIDSGANGHVAYQRMLQCRPDFFVHTGDLLYYDKAPLCKTVAQARAKWNLMFGYAYNKKFHQNVASYFMKDDHDTLKNDCWPGQTYGELTFAQGLEIFREQVPMGENTYRTFRWGKDVQIWLTENRDFRSRNSDADGPEKTILGARQKAWLQRTLVESDATFKFVISPGPLVGPDKAGKADNHSNAAFAFEGQQLRDFLAAQENTYVICGDRHWQYCSQDPKTGLMEFGCGPINGEHRFGGNPGNDQKMHRYFSPLGGFLIVTVDGNSATAAWVHAEDLDESTGLAKMLHSETLTAKQ